MPRAPKAKHQVADSRNGTALALVESAEIVVPDPPKGLRAAGKQAWLHYWESPMAQLATKADTVVITRYAKAVDEYTTALAKFERQRVVDGSQGQPRLNPLSTWVQSREAVLQGLEDRLGLSPLARLKLGIAVGEAHRSLSDMNARMLEQAAENTGSDSDWNFDDEQVIEDTA